MSAMLLVFTYTLSTCLDLFFYFSAVSVDSFFLQKLSQLSPLH